MTIMIARKDFAPYQKIAERILRRIGRALSIGNRSVAVYVVTDSFMKKNVLAFPAPKDFPRPDLGGTCDLGEIYINPMYIARQGEDFTGMLIHGFLHLWGYDHHTKYDTLAMEKKEKELANIV